MDKPCEEIIKLEILSSNGILNEDIQKFLFYKGTSPRQRYVFVLRWNPLKSSFTKDEFENEFAQLQNRKPYAIKKDLNWSVWDWHEGMKRS